MNEDALRREAAEMSESDLCSCLDWNKALAEHFDDNMDQRGYDVAQMKIRILKDELSRRG
jgi:hypothetical protein